MSINTGNNYDIDVLRKLGLASDIPQVTSTANPFVPFTLFSIPTHQDIQGFQLSIENDGTLRDYLPFFSLKKLENVSGPSEAQISEHTNYKINFQPDGFYDEIYSSIPILGQLSHNFFPKTNIKISDNDFFNKFDFKIDNLTQDILQRGINNDLSFGRVSFPAGTNNSNILSGFYYRKYSGQYVPTIIKTTTGIGNLTGSAFKLSNGSFVSWRANQTAGYDNKNYNSFYLNYPTTLDQTSFNAYSIDTKIAPFFADFPKGNETGVKINGLMLISTGSGINSKICYISPHGLKTGLMNTFVASINKNRGSTGSNPFYVGTSGVIYRGLALGSEYYTGINQFPTSGIRYIQSGDKSVTGAVGYTGEISGFWRLYNIDANQHLKQDTAIKDTLFYKFYSGLYTGSKGFNTGTWNGIIPSGTLFQIEYINCEFNKDLGSNHPFYIIYSGYGTLDKVDSKLTKFIGPSNISEITTGNFSGSYRFDYSGVPSRAKSHPSLVDEEYRIAKIGRGVGSNRNVATSKALNDLKYKFFTVYSFLLKTFAIEVIKQNRKFKNLQKFIKRQKGG
jgi:hypothetical protein